MLTVRDSQEDTVRALEEGADDHITKPFHVRGTDRQAKDSGPQKSGYPCRHQRALNR